MVTTTTQYRRIARRGNCPWISSNTVTITVTPSPTVSITATDASCGEDSGELTASATGGTAPYTYRWTGNRTGATITGLAAGTYTVTATDANGCTDTASETIGNSPAVFAVLTCEDDPVKSVNLTNYVRSCSNNSPGSAFWTGNAFRDIVPTTTDCNLAESQRWEVMGANDFSENDGGSALITLRVRNGCDPNAILNVTLGLGGRTFDTPAGSPTFGASTNCVDNNTNTSDWYYYTEIVGTIIGEGSLVGLEYSLTRTGEALQVGTGANQFNEFGQGLSAWLAPVLVSQPDNGPAVRSTSHFDINVGVGGEKLSAEPDGCLVICAGESTTITAAVVTGTAPFTYAWSNGSTGSTITVSPTETTTYTVTVTDANGCTFTDEATVTVKPQPVADITAVPATICTGETVVFTASTTGNAGATYNWDFGQYATPATADGAGPITVTYNLPASQNGNGSATATLTVSRDGCTDTDTQVINIRDTPEVTEVMATDPTCGEDNGTITFTFVDNPDRSGIEFSTNGVGGPYVSTSDNAGTFTISGLAAGTYDLYVRWGDNNCPVDLDDVTLTNQEGPDVTASDDETICIGETTTLTAVATGGTSPITYAWMPGAGAGASFAVSPTVTTTYTVTATDANGCEATDVVTITVKPNPEATVNGEVICAGESATLMATPTVGDAPFTFAWSNGGGNAASATFTPASTTTYTVTVTDANGCDNTATGTITVNPLPVADAGNNQTICLNESATLTASATGGTGVYAYEWSTNESTASITVTPTVTTTYTVTVTDAAGCTDTDQVIVTVNELPNVTDVTSTNPTCGEDNGTITITFGPVAGRTGIEFSLDGGVNYETTVSIADGSVTYDGLAAGTYDLFARFGNDDCPIDIEDAELMDENGPDVTASDDVAICLGASTTLTASATGGTGTITYTWMPGNLSGATQTVTPAATTTYTVTATDANDCIDTEQVIVTVNPNPTVSVEDREICRGETATLTAVPAGGTAPFTYEWSSGDDEATTEVMPTNTTVYTVTVTDANGCTGTTSATVTVNPLPIGDASDDVTLCDGASTTVTISGRNGTPPYTYAWSNGDDGTSTVINADDLNFGNNNIFVTTTDSKGCTDVDIVMINKVPNPVATPTDDEICAGETATVSVSASSGLAPYTYAWEGGQETTSIDVSPTTTTDYEVTVTDANGCTDVATATVTVNPRPVVDAGDDVRLCTGDEVTLTATATQGTAPYTYVWSTTENGASITVNPVATTTYTVVVTDSEGCTDTDEVTVVVLPLPVVTNVQSTNPTCGEDNGTIIIFFDPVPGRGAIEFSLDGGAFFEDAVSINSGSVTYEDLDAGTYDLVVRFGNGECPVDIEDVDLMDENAPVVTASDDDAICAGASADISATVTGGTGVITYVWMPGNLMGADQTVTPASTTTYTVTATDENGCVDTDVVVITVNDKPVVTVADDEICLGESAELTAVIQGGTAPFTYAWTPEGENQMMIAVEPAATTVYTVVVTDANGCTGTTTATVTVNPLPVGDASNDVTICAGNSADLTVQGFAGTPPYTFTWSTDEEGDAITVMPTDLGTTEYFVTTTDANGCTDVDIIAVTVVPNPVVTVEDQEICVGETATLTAVATGGNGVFTYEWSTSGVTASIDVMPTVTREYTVTVTSTYTNATTGETTECTDVTTATVTVNELPAITISPSDDDGTTCAGTEVTLTATISGGESPYAISWTEAGSTVELSDASTLTVSPLTSTTYVVMVTDANGCEQEEEIEITVDPTQCVFLGDFVFEDTNGNGQQDLDEPGVPNATVNLKDASGNVIGTTTTGTNGEYSFTDLVPGTYSVQFVLPSGFEFFTTANVGDDESDSDADPAMNGMTATTTLAEGESDITLDAGVFNPASLGDFVFLDENGNGQQDDMEPGIPGVTVTLTDAMGNPVTDVNGDPVGPVVTGPNGEYLFDDLFPGDYVVTFANPNGDQTPTDQNVGDDATDSDINDAGVTGVVTLESGENDDTVDAGYIPANLSIGSSVFVDANNDGIQQADEAGIAGVTVEVYAAGDTPGVDAPVGTDVTDADGIYFIDGLTPGDYVVYLPMVDGDNPISSTNTDTADNQEDGDDNGIQARTAIRLLPRSSP